MTAAPELRTTASGTSVTSFTLAVERSYASKGEERQIDWIDVVAWRHNAEFITKYFVKGQLMAVRGAVQTCNYEDRNGNKRKAVEIVADEGNFCGPPPGRSTEKSPQSETKPEASELLAELENGYTSPSFENLDFDALALNDMDLPF